MITKLPLELTLEIISHMGLEQLLNFITAYPVLQSYTVIITDLPITEGSSTSRIFENQFARPSIEQLFPTIDRYHFSQNYQIPLHKYVKIFDLCDPLIKTEIPYFSTFPDTHSCCTLISMGFVDEDANFNNISPNMETTLDELADKLTFVYLERTVSQRVHGEFHELGWKTGCKIQLDALSCLSHLQRKTRVSKLMRFSSQKWLGLTELHLEHSEKIELGDLHSNIKLVSVTFTREGSDNSVPLFSINSAQKLQTLIIKYVGEYVPVISVKNAYNIDHTASRDNKFKGRIVDCDGFIYDTFRLIRVCDTSSMLPVSHTNQMEKYTGDLNFLQRCTSLSLIGVPDWFVLLYCPQLSNLEEFHWERIDPTPMPHSMDSYRLIYPKIHVIYIRSVIPYDQLPSIVDYRGDMSSGYKPQCTLDVIIQAPGLNLNGLLTDIESFCRVNIRAFPFRKEILRNAPALTIDKSDTKFWRKDHLQLCVSGDVYLKFLEEEPFPSDVYREFGPPKSDYIDGADLDIGRTAAMNHGAVSMYWFAPHYGDSHEEVRLRCHSRQKVSVNLVTGTLEAGESYKGKTFTIDKEITKVFIDGIQTETHEVSPHCKHHCSTTWQFRPETISYNACRSKCFKWREHQKCSCDHLDRERF